MPAVRVELHCHSVHSDGSETAIQVARLAAEFGVELFCLTDHDTCAGWGDTVATLPGITVLRGMELSCRSEGRNVHLLLYGIQDGAGRDALDRVLVQQQQRRRTRVFEICARFKQWNIVLDPEHVLAQAKGTPGRPHIARALVEAKVCTSVPEAFTRFLRDGGPADVPAPHLDVFEALPLARAAGARVSLAHPQSMGSPAFVQSLCDRARGEGLEGIEAFSGAAPRRTWNDWQAFAADRKLVVTAGSDFHGTKVVPQVVHPGLDMPEPHATRLREWLSV